MDDVDWQGLNDHAGALVERATAQLRKQQSEIGFRPEHPSSVIQLITGNSLTEIENLISDLRKLRDYLLKETQRVQHEIKQYAQISQTATKSTRIMVESLAMLKSSAEPDHRPHG
jgi:hypothetical protein